MQRPSSLDDVDAILVYADALMQKGDPHGNLIALQHGKKTKQANAWLQKHAATLLGPLAEIEHVTLEWQSGFIRKAAMEAMVDHYDQVRACPAGQLVAELQLDQAPMDVPSCTTHQGYCYEPVLDRIVEQPLPTLRALRIGSMVSKPEYNCMHGLARVLESYPGLELLRLNGGVYDFGSPKLPKLRSLRIIADHDGATIRALAKADLPALEDLELHGGGNHGDEPTGADYAELFAAERMPKLRKLVFSNHDDAFPDCVQALLRSPLLPRLEELALDFIDNAIADLVIEDPTPLRHIKHLRMTTLERGDVTPSRRKRLQAALPKLKTKRG